jgi:hypothetical protein
MNFFKSYQKKLLSNPNIKIGILTAEWLQGEGKKLSMWMVPLAIGGK